MRDEKTKRSKDRSDLARLHPQLFTFKFERLVRLFCQILDPNASEAFPNVCDRKQRAQHCILFRIQWLRWNCLAGLEELEKALRSLRVAMSRRKNLEQISSPRPERFTSENRSHPHVLEILEPEPQQLCLKVGSELLYGRIVGSP